ncbi:hypothetical protein EVAR_33041_1 [Eumeta japonica]|uniref:Uncharacterized protein n=1 Tax=Eumeta variegata TaxID=151549 RepID=A0A4C1WVC1_EUMVA|nr:hypothetical protein EVAR_33041_1 [Eumeta japonica]
MELRLVLTRLLLCDPALTEGWIRPKFRRAVRESRADPGGLWGVTITAELDLCLIVVIKLEEILTEPHMYAPPDSKAGSTLTENRWSSPPLDTCNPRVTSAFLTY